MDDVLRRSVAHVHVADVAVPVPDDPTLHHLAQVLRVRDGESITVTDGAGSWRACRFVDDALEPVAEAMSEPPAATTVTVAVAPPKGGNRVEWLVQKCTEIGVDRIVVLAAERSVVRWIGERGDRHLERLRRVGVEAALQSRRVWFPDVIGPLPAGQVLVGAVAAEPSGRPLGPADTVVAIGPEGGWSSSELAVAADTVSLGANVLRVDTAAVVAATLMAALRERGA